MTSRAKCSAATIFDYQNFTSDLLHTIGNGLEYAIIGHETCPSTSRIHYQCYFKFNSPVCFTTLSVILPRGSHIEKSKGTPYQNYQYCSKENIQGEIGTRPNTPNRKRKQQEEKSTLLKDIVKHHLQQNSAKASSLKQLTPKNGGTGTRTKKW
ncbi:hypothetical protein DINM_021705 [Dirofilaria immitis]|nr:hypothetical protein [Dirofilaria immitis]